MNIAHYLLLGLKGYFVALGFLLAMLATSFLVCILKAIFCPDDQEDDEQEGDEHE